MNGIKQTVFRWLSIAALATAIVLEALPNGAALKFAPGPDETVMQYYSYFDFTPFGYANFAPLITAFLTVLIAGAEIALTLSRRKIRKLDLAVLAASAAAVIISVCPIFYGLDYYTAIGAVISVMLALSAVFYMFSVYPIGNKSNEQHE